MATTKTVILIMPDRTLATARAVATVFAPGAIRSFELYFRAAHTAAINAAIRLILGVPIQLPIHGFHPVRAPYVVTAGVPVQPVMALSARLALPPVPIARPAGCKTILVLGVSSQLKVP